MAAGRVDVRRRDDVHHSKKENLHCRNSYRALDFCQGQDKHSRLRNSGYSSYVDTIEADGREYGGAQSRRFVGRSRDGELREISGRDWSGDAFASQTKAGVNDISNFEEESMRPEKKRRFSPIVWDRDDKEARIASKKRMLSESCKPSGSTPFLPESFGKLTSVVSDAVYNATTTTQPQGIQILSAKSHVAGGSVGRCGSEHIGNSFSLLHSEQCGKNDEDLGQVEDSEYVEVRHISASRWAIDEDSPQKMRLDNSGNISTRRIVHPMGLMDTPESGEFRGEGSLGNQGMSSASDGLDISMAPVSRESESEVVTVGQDISGMPHLHSDFEDDNDSSWSQELAASKPKTINMLQGCRSVFEYEKLRRINEGTYGVVYKAKDKKTNEIMALKKVKMGIERDGFPLSSLREINILLALHHPSIVDVKEVVMDKYDDVFMVMEYMEHDLKGLIGVLKQPFSEKEVKYLMLQLLEGVKYLHDNWVLHRDLKTSNILLDNNGKLKICDLGLSRRYGSPLKPYTPLVVTLWYRAPELLLGMEQYSTAVDMWSVGCIMAELLAKQPLFNGKTEFDQLDKIFRILGMPNDTIWPGYSKLPEGKVKYAKQLRNTLREKFPAISFKGSPVLSDQGFDLLSQLLTFDPEKRITAEAALKHSWFDISECELVSVQESLALKLRSMT